MISSSYEKEYHQKINSVSVSRILKNMLDLHYKKTIQKNPKLGEDKYILITFLFFLKIISRCLKLGLNFIYVDGTGVTLNNNNLKIWRKDKEEVLGGPKNKGNDKINLIMEISHEEILYGQYYENQSISSEEFEDFLKELLSTISKKEIEK